MLSSAARRLLACANPRAFNPFATSARLRYMLHAFFLLQGTRRRQRNTESRKITQERERLLVWIVTLWNMPMMSMYYTRGSVGHALQGWHDLGVGVNVCSNSLHVC